MRSVFSNVLKKQLPALFAKRFPEFRQFKPKGAVAGVTYPLPLAATYFRRVRGDLWEIIAIRRLSQDGWTVDLFWSTYARFPYARLSIDYTADIGSLKRKEEAHTGLSNIVGERGASTWRVWKCSLPYNHPDFQTQYVIEYMKPVDPADAEKVVAEQLDATADAIEDFVLPFFAELEEREKSRLRRCDDSGKLADKSGKDNE